MFDSRVYNQGTLIVGKMSGRVKPQSFINGIFWQIDSRNAGEVKAGFSQLYYDDNVQSVTVTEKDIKHKAEINTDIGMNIGRFRTAQMLRHPEIIRLAKLHQILTKEHGYDVALFDTFEEGFVWLDYENPDPASIYL
jgi:hypothetical protein